MVKKHILFAAAAALLASGPVLAGETPSTPDAQVYFVNIADGDTVESPVKVVFGLSGMGVAPAGVDWPDTGHHHLFINRPPFGEGEDGADEADYNIPADDNHIHYGDGQTETVLELPPGPHTLQLVLGDKDHIPHNPPVVSDVITVTVK